MGGGVIGVAADIRTSTLCLQPRPPTGGNNSSGEDRPIVIGRNGAFTQVGEEGKTSGARRYDVRRRARRRPRDRPGRWCSSSLQIAKKTARRLWPRSVLTHSPRWRGRWDPTRRSDLRLPLDARLLPASRPGLRPGSRGRPARRAGGRVGRARRLLRGRWCGRGRPRALSRAGPGTPAARRWRDGRGRGRGRKPSCCPPLWELALGGSGDGVRCSAWKWRLAAGAGGQLPGRRLHHRVGRAIFRRDGLFSPGIAAARN